MEKDCIFCKIANGEIPASTVYEDDMFRVILDMSPATKGHALILPKKHMADIFEMDSETAEKAFGKRDESGAELRWTEYCAE